MKENKAYACNEDHQIYIAGYYEKVKEGKYYHLGYCSKCKKSIAINHHTDELIYDYKLSDL